MCNIAISKYSYGKQITLMILSNNVMLRNLGRVPIEECRLDPTSRHWVDPTFNRVPTDTIILGRPHSSSYVGLSIVHISDTSWVKPNSNLRSRSHYAI